MENSRIKLEFIGIIKLTQVNAKCGVSLHTKLICGSPSQSTKSWGGREVGKERITEEEKVRPGPFIERTKEKS